jgi:murein peptide amidase A
MADLSSSNSGPNRWLFTRQIGTSRENRPILLHETAPFKAASGGTLLIGGVHGDERATIHLLLSFQDRLLRENRVDLATLPIGIIPLANPDGFVRKTRVNAAGVDINRNFAAGWSPNSDEPPGPEPWSEPETRALRDFIEFQRPHKIVTLHWALGELDPDGAQSIPLARAMWDALTLSEKLPYRLREECAPCPGSLGQWCGGALRYPDGTAPAIITLELPFDPALPRPTPLPADHLEHLERHWQNDAQAYLAATQRTVHKLLAAACRFNASKG